MDEINTSRLERLQAELFAGKSKSMGRRLVVQLSAMTDEEFEDWLTKAKAKMAERERGNGRTS